MILNYSPFVKGREGKGGEGRRRTGQDREGKGRHTPFCYLHSYEFDRARSSYEFCKYFLLDMHGKRGRTCKRMRMTSRNFPDPMPCVAPWPAQPTLQHPTKKSQPQEQGWNRASCAGAPIGLPHCSRAFQNSCQCHPRRRRGGSIPKSFTVAQGTTSRGPTDWAQPLLVRILIRILLFLRLLLGLFLILVLLLFLLL